MTTPAAAGELLATTAAAEREAERLRDRLAAIEEEQATLEAELAVFNADYMREVVTVLAELHELEARIAGARRQALGHGRGQARGAVRACPRP